MPNDFDITRCNVFSTQVCTSLDTEAATKLLNEKHPSGTDAGWFPSDRDNAQPVPCSEHPETHRHILYDC